MSKLVIDTAPVFRPLLEPKRYKAAHGGRGSAKSHFFAEHMVEYALLTRGFRGLCGREIQKSLKESAKRLIEDKLTTLGLGGSHGFKVFNDVIQTPGDGAIMFQGLQDHTAESIKSFEGLDVAWLEEAANISSRSLQLLRPTVRKDGSEMWFSWNRRLRTDPVDVLFHPGASPTGSAVVQSNWRDNPWFPAVLEQERLDCLANNPDQYDHIWEGDYVSVSVGAYFAAGLAKAKAEHRIGKLNPDPLLSIRAYFDIGGTGAKADAVSIWMVQFVGREIRVLNYYEAQGQPLATHVNWLRANGYGKCMCVLPHDGDTNDRVHDVSYASALRAADFDVTVIPNQGKGAAAARIEAVRRILPNCYFDAAKTEPGRLALGWYHEKKDEARNVGLGPEHDWSSHGADAFGLMAVAYERHSAPPDEEWQDDNAWNSRNGTTGY